MDSVSLLVEKWNDALNAKQFDDIASFVLARAVAIQQIPAPTFHEADRAAFVADEFRNVGLESVEVDAVHNVYGILRGKRSDTPALMLTAHLDTVFSADTDLAIRQEAERIYGAGLGDNSIGVAALLAFVEYLRTEAITPDCDIWIVATSCEEGLGDLKGMKAAFARLRPDVGAVINLEGMSFGYIYHAGIAVRRLHITATTAGGHSWAHFGRASAIHTILALGNRLLSIRPAQTPRTTYNIGMIEGGEAINVIAPRAGLWLDMRSETQVALAAVESQVRAHIAAIEKSEVEIKIEVVGDRPAGAISPDHPLVQGALSALEQIGILGALQTGSTDGNVSLAEGCPTVTIGITRGENAHRLDEYIEIAPIADGMRQFVMLALATATYLSMQSD